ETVETGGGKDDAKVEREVACLRAVRGPCDPGAPVVEAKQRRQREQQQGNDDIDGAGADDRWRVIRRRGRVFDDDFSFGCGHWSFLSPPPGPGNPPGKRMIGSAAAPSCGAEGCWMPHSRGG